MLADMEDYIELRELRGELRGKLRGKLRGDLRDDLMGELRGELRGEPRGELRGKLRGDLHGCAAVSALHILYHLIMYQNVLLFYYNVDIDCSIIIYNAMAFVQYYVHLT